MGAAVADGLQVWLACSNSLYVSAEIYAIFYYLLPE
jgi:hypothetical protein